MSGDDGGTILAKHGVLPHTRDRESSAGTAAQRRHAAKMKTRDAAIALLETVQGSLDMLKAHLGRQRHTYADMTAVIAEEAMNVAAGRTFDSNPGGVSEAQITMVVKAADRTGCERVTWEEVLSFMIDAGMKGKSAEHLDSYKGFTEQVCYNTSSMSSVSSFRYIPPLDMALVCERASSLYWVSPGRDYASSDKPKLTRELNAAGNAPLVLSYDYHTVARCVAVSYADLSLVLFELRDSKLASSVKTDTSTTTVRCLNDTLYTGDRDGSVTFWGVKRVHPPSEVAQYTTTTTSRAGNVPLGSIPTLVVEKKLTPHTGSITDIIWIDSQGCLVSASLDKTITILSPMGAVVRRLATPECNPLSGLAYSPEANALVSIGACCQVFVWHISNSSTCDPFVLEDKDRPHLGGLCGVVPLPDARVATSDARGCIKVWCLASFRCLESLQVGTNMVAQGVRGRLHPPLHTMMYAERTRHIVVANNSRAWLFEYDTVSSSVGLRQSAHDTAVASLQFNHTDNTIVTCGGDTVRVWSVRTGAQLAKYVLPYEIMSFALTEDCTHFITGQASGELSVYNLASGTHVRTLPRKHTTDITSMTVCEGKKAVFATSWDGSVWLQTLEEDRHPPAAKAQKPTDGSAPPPPPDELCWSPETGRLRGEETRRDRNADAPRCVAYSPSLGLCAVGGESDTVTTWGTHRGRTVNIKLQATLQPDESARNPTGAALREVSALCFIDDYPVLAAGNSSGKIHLFSLPPYTYPNNCISWWSTAPPTKPGVVSHAATVTAFAQVALNPTTVLLYAADDDGCVACFNIAPVLEEYGMVPDQPESHGITPSTSAASSPTASPPLRAACAAAKHRHTYPDPSKHIVHQVRRWRAHAGGIIAMSAIAKHNMIATAGVDRQVALWSLNGVLVGSLDQNGKGGYSPLSAPLTATIGAAPLRMCDIPDGHLRPRGYEARLSSLREPSTPPQHDDAAEDTERCGLSLPAVVKFQSKFKLSTRKNSRPINCGASMCSGSAMSRKKGDAGSRRAPSCFGGDMQSMFGDETASVAAGRLAPLKLNFDGEVPKKVGTKLQRMVASLRPSADMMSSVCPSEQPASRKGPGSRVGSGPGSRVGSAGTSRMRLPALPTGRTASSDEPSVAQAKSRAGDARSVAASRKSGRSYAAASTSVTVTATPGAMSLRSALKTSRRPPAGKALPSDYLSMLSNDPADAGYRPSLVTTNDEDVVATTEPHSVHDSAMLPQGSREYRAGLMHHREAVHVELTNRVTGLSQVVVMNTARKQHGADAGTAVTAAA